MVESATDIDINLLLIDSDLVQPNNFNYYYYHGSLTAPPCDEYVQWFIVADPLPIGSTVLDMFKE